VNVAEKTLPYDTFVFDCDGVILNSNRIKTEAFREVALRFGEQAAEVLVQFHVQHGGISRYRKFEYLLENILLRTADPQEVAALAKDYGDCIYHHLLDCEVAADLNALREATASTSWMVVSGGDQEELRRVFSERGLLTLFDGGIYGSPNTKDEILSKQIQSGRLRKPALFLGDSQYDHEAAVRAGLDFIFVSNWTEFSSWPEYCQANKIGFVNQLADAF
jgi:phosphoglycolate phosphatase-like HAD superfamily hydrolase